MAWVDLHDSVLEEFEEAGGWVNEVLVTAMNRYSSARYQEALEKQRIRSKERRERLKPLRPKSPRMLDREQAAIVVAKYGASTPTTRMLAAMRRRRHGRKTWQLLDALDFVVRRSQHES